MQESVALVANIYEAGVKTRHELLHLGDLDVANREIGRALLVLVFHEPLVFEQGDGYFLWLYVDNYFACHLLISLIIKRDPPIRHVPFPEQS